MSCALLASEFLLCLALSEPKERLHEGSLQAEFSHGINHEASKREDHPVQPANIAQPIEQAVRLATPVHHVCVHVELNACILVLCVRVLRRWPVDPRAGIGSADLVIVKVILLLLPVLNRGSLVLEEVKPVAAVEP